MPPGLKQARGLQTIPNKTQTCRSVDRVTAISLLPKTYFHSHCLHKYSYTGICSHYLLGCKFLRFYTDLERSIVELQ